MKNLDFALHAIDSSKKFINSLNKKDFKKFAPTKSSLNNGSELLSLGFSTFGLKLYYMLGEWDKLSDSERKEWIDYINSFQKNYKNLPKNSFLDNVLINHYSKFSPSSLLKDLIRSILNFLPIFQYDTNSIKFKKAVNAETKQAISTIYQVGFLNSKPYIPEQNDDLSVKEYLNSLNWSTPWSSGAQFASMCVYSKINSSEYDDLLQEFIASIANSDTGSYYTTKPNHSREIINGAMKVLTGLDWLDYEIHYPEKLIDYCINNKPVMEGCDIVDYIYVLYRCSAQTDYKKEAILKIFDDSIDDIKKLFHEGSGGFSYFRNKSQTHYYGVPITDGENEPDLHGTLLCIWALMMILDANKQLEEHYKLIKP